MRLDWLEKLQHLLQTLAFCLTVSALQYAVQPSKSYVLPLVYSLCIGTCTWALMDFGRHLFASAAETGWPTGRGGVLLPLLGICGGYLAGTLLGDQYFGWSSWDANPQARMQLPFSIIVTGVAGIVASYYFYSRNKAAYLEARVAQVSQQSAQAQLRLLQSQLDPHLLFNTLANLRALITLDSVAALAMLDRMDAYLRATLTASRSTQHPLAAEFERLRDYLELMRIRMGERLHYQLDLPPELADLQVPTLLLQPLVENSIRHGLEPKIEGGSVTVSARRDGDALVLQVQDTGVGLGERSGWQEGFGLGQLRERLATLHGQHFSLDWTTPEQGGTRIAVRFAAPDTP